VLTIEARFSQAIQVLDDARTLATKPEDAATVERRIEETRQIAMHKPAQSAGAGAP